MLKQSSNRAAKRLRAWDAFGHRQRRWLVLSSIVVAASTSGPRPPIVGNWSPSIPLGIYVTVTEEPAAGRLVEFPLPIVSTQKTFARHRLLLKPVLAGPGDHVDTTSESLWINGRRIAPIHTTDSHGRPLPVWRANRTLQPDEFFVYSARVPNSLDSRYYGPIRRDQITAVRVPLWSWGELTETLAVDLRPHTDTQNPK